MRHGGFLIDFSQNSSLLEELSQTQETVSQTLSEDVGQYSLCITICSMNVTVCRSLVNERDYFSLCLTNKVHLGGHKMVQDIL